MRFIAIHSPMAGIICLILASLLLSWWELRRLTSTGSLAVGRGMIADAIAAGVISFALISLRFMGII